MGSPFMCHTVKMETVNRTLIVSLHFENPPDVLTHDNHTRKFKPMTLWSQDKVPKQQNMRRNALPKCSHKVK